RGVALCVTGAGSGTGTLPPAHRVARRVARRAIAAVGMPVPHALLEGDGRLCGGPWSGARRSRSGPSGCLPVSRLPARTSHASRCPLTVKPEMLVGRPFGAPSLLTGPAGPLGYTAAPRRSGGIGRRASLRGQRPFGRGGFR